MVIVGLINHWRKHTISGLQIHAIIVLNNRIYNIINMNLKQITWGIVQTEGKTSFRAIVMWHGRIAFHWCACFSAFAFYRQVSNIRRTLVDNKIVDHSDVVGASPVGVAPTTSSFST